MSTDLFWSIKQKDGNQLPLGLKWAIQEANITRPSLDFIRGFYYAMYHFDSPDSLKDKKSVEALIEAMERGDDIEFEIHG